MASQTKETWNRFANAGMLWFTNRLLHVFGWCIVVEENEEGLVSDVYPARCDYLGFTDEVEQEGRLKFRNSVAEDTEFGYPCGPENQKRS